MEKSRSGWENGSLLYLVTRETGSEVNHRAGEKLPGTCDVNAEVEGWKTLPGSGDEGERTSPSQEGIKPILKFLHEEEGSVNGR